MSAPRLALLALTSLAAIVSRPWSIAAQAAVAPTPPLPATGLDFSGVDEFWKIVDVLSRDREPPDSQWNALLSTAGYRLAQTNLGPVIREDLEVTFRPSRRTDFARLSAGGEGGTDDRALRLRHLALALTERTALVALRDSFAHGAPIADAVAMAARFLPSGATTRGQPPLVAFALFKDDAYSLPQGIVVDLLYARTTPLLPILAHEFHHTFVNRLNKPAPAGPPASDATIRDALYDLRNEGIADQIDKPYPVTSRNPGMAQYVTRYNAEYARTPATLRLFDSLLTQIADHPDRLDGLGMQAQMVFWSNGHPNGAYMAREVIETFGVDSLFPGARDPAAFLRTYAAAERAHGRPAPFSAKTWGVIDALDVKYWR